MTWPGRTPQLPDLIVTPKRLHLVGIGGAAMNALATLLVGMGHQVSGSDQKPSAVLERLEKLGVRVYIGHDAANVGDVDGLAFSTAVKEGNPEVGEALRRGIPVYNRPQLTAAICRSRRTLAVSGTHGKTTTTAMLAAVMSRAGWEPGYLVGGELPGGGGGAQWGTGEWLVVEADESDGTFVEIGAPGAVVTNVEPDHLDFYGDMTHLTQAFERFVAQATDVQVLCADDPGAAALAHTVPSALTYGQRPGAGVQVVNLALGEGRSTFDLVWSGERLGGSRWEGFSLAVPGQHNVLNAAAAFTAALAASKFDPGIVGPAREALAAYRSVSRRFELRGQRDGVTYVDDYAHNPGKVRAALAGARTGGWGRIVAVFQPHRYSRTAALWQGFADAFVDADVVLVTGIYPAGEAPLAGVSGRMVADAVRAAHPGAAVEYVEDRPPLVERLRQVLRPGDLCLTMGAGDLTTLPSELLGAP